MESEKVSFLHQIKSEAEKIIINGYKPEENRCEKLIQIIIMPAFGSIVSWEIFEVEKNEVHEYFIVETFWDKKEDINKLEMPNFNLKMKYNKLHIEPSIVNKRTALESTFVEEIISRLKNIKISLQPIEYPIGCDGVFYKIKLGNLFHNLEMMWWLDGPDEWKELTSFVNDMLSKFEEI